MQRRCSVLPDQSKFINCYPENDETNEILMKIYFQLLVYELLYIWNTLSSCNETNLNLIIENCKLMSENHLRNEPLIGVSYLIIGASYSKLKMFDEAIYSYRKCVTYCDRLAESVALEHIPAFANYELALLLLKSNQEDVSIPINYINLNFRDIN